jgi:hypothetical protein
MRYQGLIKPYRPCPADFRERYLEMGWDGIEDHYRTGWLLIRRWIDESGGEELRAARRAITGSAPKPKLRSQFRVDGARAS